MLKEMLIVEYFTCISFKLDILEIQHNHLGAGTNDVYSAYDLSTLIVKFVDTVAYQRSILKF